LWRQRAKEADWQALSALPIRSDQGGIHRVETNEKKQFLDEFKDEWKSMWRNRLDDKVRAEGIVDKDYSLLSVDRGTVIIATRKFKLLDFRELLRNHELAQAAEMIIQPNPLVGGWGKFVRTALVTQNLKRQRGRAASIPYRNAGQQLKKGGRGWLHIRH
jgi:hypothetical protein